MWLITEGRRWETIHSYVTIDELIRRKGNNSCCILTLCSCISLALTQTFYVATKSLTIFVLISLSLSLNPKIQFVRVGWQICEQICTLIVKRTNSVNGTHLHFKIYSHSVSEQAHWLQFIFRLLCFFTPHVTVLSVYHRGCADPDHVDKSL